MITTTKISAAPKPAELQDNYSYPILGVHRENGRVVLFTDRAAGIVVVKGTGSEPVGRVSTDWLMHYYVAFQGEVKISNK